jgi:ATP-dependent helicase STH1/SNF2
MEFQKWAPAINTLILKGSPLQRKDLYPRLRAGDFQVCLTTYEYIIKERPVLSKIKWIHMIIDEGHRMKNVKSKLSQTLNEYYTTRYRLILTGTPLQVSVRNLSLPRSTLSQQQAAAGQHRDQILSSMMC